MDWRHLKHQNIIPLLGVTSAPLQFIFEWAPGGNLIEYVNKNPDADRVRLVSAPPSYSGLRSLFL